MAKTTWRKLIQDEMVLNDDSFDNVISSTLKETELDEKFDSGFGDIEGRPFTVWTKTRVYFPKVYDGAEWCNSVSRNPDGKPTNHIGNC